MRYVANMYMANGWMVWDTQLKPASSFLLTAPSLLSIVFFTTSLTAVMLDVGSTIKSELCGLACKLFVEKMFTNPIFPRNSRGYSPTKFPANTVLVNNMSTSIFQNDNSRWLITKLVGFELINCLLLFHYPMMWVVDHHAALSVVVHGCGCGTHTRCDVLVSSNLWNTVKSFSEAMLR